MIDEFKNASAALAGLIFVCGMLSATGQAQQLTLPAIIVSGHELPAEIDRILALGDADFQNRIRAGHCILSQPIAMHDWLYRARNSSDPEIARASRQLRRQICLNGLLVDAAPAAGAYARGDLNERQRAIEQFGRTRSPDSTEALLGLVRYETWERLSQIAAIEIIAAGRDATTIREAVADSPRQGAQWLRVWFSDLDSDEFVRQWEPLIDSLMTNVAESRQPVVPEHVAGLIRQTAVRYWNSGQSQRATELVCVLCESCRNDPLRLVELFDWLIYQQQYRCADRLVRCHAERFGNDPRLAMRLAELCKIKGQLRKADQTAARVCRQLSGDMSAVIELAIHLRDSRLEHWAIRLLSDCLTSAKQLDPAGISASRVLARIHYDRQNFQSAARTLERVIQEIPDEPNQNQRWPDLKNKLIAQSSYYWHRYHLGAGAADRARRHLLTGLQACPANSALLIAATQFPQTGPQWQPAIDELVQLALQQHEREIQSLQSRPTDDPRQRNTNRHFLAAELNAYAWLAARTGHNLVQAERYARRAARINPDDTNLLDTLAACLHAQGKYQLAMECQSRAVEMSPFDPALQSGLNRYRQAQAATAAWPGLFR